MLQVKIIYYDKWKMKNKYIMTWKKNGEGMFLRLSYASRERISLRGRAILLDRRKTELYYSSKEKDTLHQKNQSVYK